MLSTGSAMPEPSTGLRIPPLGLLPEIIRRLEFNHVLDLGCGSGALLRELASQDSCFIGWGIDLNRAMCEMARARIRTARLGKRVRVRGRLQKAQLRTPSKGQSHGPMR